jgi:NAD(P)H-hydrate epimerase
VFFVYFSWLSCSENQGDHAMILLHALDAPYDIPGLDIQRGDTMYHLLSDLPGAEGTAELLAFVRACGGQDSWMQSPGTYREHFDIFGAWAEVARELGAREATGREVAAVLARKHAAMTDAAIAVPAITSRQMRVVDDLMTGPYGVDLRQMMELAGARLAELARQPLGGTLAGKRIAVLAGPGNNGGGGLVAARHLTNAGAQAQVWLAADEARLGAVLAGHLATLRALGLAPRIAHVPDAARLAACDLIIDALLGYSIADAPRGLIAATIRAANAAAVPILALDLPSGLDANEAGPYDPCIRAAATMTLALPKRGLALVAAQPYIGDLWLADIGIPRRAFKRVGTRVGPLFAASPLVRLWSAPLAGTALASDVVQWRVQE